MELTCNTSGDSRVAVAHGEAAELATVQDALDLLATIRHLHDSDKLLIEKALIDESFFDLRTGFAGEVLQKFTNYGLRVAIVGDFSGYTSKALRDFIYESNNGDRVFFLAGEAEALERLHRLPNN